MGTEKESFKALCPLFKFQISQVLIGEHTHEEAEKYFKDLRTKLEQGIEINDDILAYKTKYANLIFVIYDLGIMFITLRLSDHFSFLKFHRHTAFQQMFFEYGYKAPIALTL